jgi:hypothetical protein
VNRAQRDDAKRIGVIGSFEERRQVAPLPTLEGGTHAAFDAPAVQATVHDTASGHWRGGVMKKQPLLGPPKRKHKITFGRPTAFRYNRTGTGAAAPPAPEPESPETPPEPLAG